MCRIFSFLGIGLFLFAGCAPRRADDQRAIDSLRIEAEAFLRGRSTMEFNSRRAGTPSNLDSLYGLHAGLFTLPAIERVSRAREEESDTLQRKRLDSFQRFLTLEYLARATAPFTDTLTTFNAEAREKVRQTCRRLAKELGYSSYPAMMERLNGFSPDSVRALAMQTLAESDSLYFALLPSRETPAPFQSPGFDPCFPRKEALPGVRRTYRSMGIDLSARGNVSFDTADRPAKNRGARCFPLSVPDDVRISVNPSGGAEDFAALYHEMGHAQQYAHITEQAFEFRYLGEPTAAETYAFLSEYILCNPAWLREYSRMDVRQLKDYVLEMALKRLYRVRRYSAQVLFEYAYLQGEQRPDSLYADWKFGSAIPLRALFLEAQLNRWLSERYGVNWYENPRAGTFLTSLWAQGGRLTAEDLASQIGAAGITPDAWIAEIREMVRLAAREDRP